MGREPFSREEPETMRFTQPAPTFTTDRLVLRPLSIEDAPAIQRYFERREVVQYLNKSVPWPYPSDGAQVYLEQVLLPAVESGRERAWALCLEGQLIGAISIACEGEENRGFWLAPEYWNQGYMSEASRRINAYLFGELGWNQIVTGNAQGNEASSRLKRAQGFEHIATFAKEFVAGPMPYEQWRLTREAWLASQKPLIRRAHIEDAQDILEVYAPDRKSVV